MIKYINTFNTKVQLLWNGFLELGSIRCVSLLTVLVKKTIFFNVAQSIDTYVHKIKLFQDILMDDLSFYIVYGLIGSGLQRYRIRYFLCFVGFTESRKEPE